MLRISLLVSVLAATACTTDAPIDELAGESAADGEEGKADSAAAFTFFNVSPDVRACSFDARCGGFFVSRPNRSVTNCGRFVPSSSERCYVDSIDWSGTGMPDSVALSYERRIREGETIILRGDISPDPADRGASLRVTEVWTSGSDYGVSEGVTVLVKDSGIRCITAPCPTMREQKLNSNVASVLITDLDLEVSGADQETIDRAHGDVFDDGVIVVGYRFSGKKNLKGRTANQFFLRAPVPQF